MNLTSNKATLLMAGSLLMTAALTAQAGPVACSNGGVNDTHSASANGAYADACYYYSDSKVANVTDITNLTNSIWGASDPFIYVGKSDLNDDPELKTGFKLEVSSSDDGFKNFYQLIVPDAWAGTTVDWVLGVKQSNNSYMSYLFEDVTLGIDGGFDNFWLNKKGKEVNDYSFSAGFIRVVDVPVPEPGSIALLGLGLIGLRFARQRSKAA